MQLHNLKRNTPNKTKKRVGRGGKRGKTSGRGMKGQKARAGRKLRPQLRDTLKKIPKKRGYRFSSIKEKPQTVNVSLLDARFSAGDDITPKILKEHGIIKGIRGKKLSVKILGNGDIKKKLTVSQCTFSEGAKQKIEKAGGHIE